MGRCHTPAKPTEATPRCPGIDAAPAKVRAVYRLDLNEWQGSSTLQLVVEHVEPV